MFSRWLFVRLKAAETALKNGRIDEAYGAALEPDVREHRRGQKLLDDLVKPLLARARLHAQAGRYRDALHDLDKLAAVARGGPEEASLRQRVTEELRRRQQRDAERNDAYAKAADDLNAGRLASARLKIDRVENTQRREQLEEDLDIRVERSAQILAQARTALEGADVLAAIRLWEEATRRHGRSTESDMLAQKLAPACRDTLDLWFKNGQLDRFAAVVEMSASLRQLDPALDTYRRTAKLCAQAAEQLAVDDYGGLRETLLRLRAARGGVRWLDTALEAVKSIVDSHEKLLSSPLGICGPSIHKTGAFGTKETLPAAHNVQHKAERPDRGRAAADKQDALLMLVDGTGSSLLVTSRTVRIGRAGGDRRVDVPIPGDIHSHHADIIRHGEDYFLTAYGPTMVNRREVKKTLLRDGDRIALAPKVKLVFRKPSSKSDSAVLKLSDRCRLPQDVSDVVLFVDTCLIGPQESCHVRTREGDSRLVLFDRAGQLCARMANADGSGVGEAGPVAVGQTREFGDVRVTIKQYEVGNTGDRA